MNGGYALKLKLPKATARAEVEGALSALARDGGFHGSLDRMQSRKELYALLGYTPGEQWNHPANRA